MTKRRSLLVAIVLIIVSFHIASKLPRRSKGKENAPQTKLIEISTSLKGTIDTLNNKGEGVLIVTQNGINDPFMSYRMSNTLEGEKVLFQTTNEGSRSKIQDATLVRILESSPDRVEPVCPIASTCGGCQLQHQRYEAQLLFKHRLVKDAFEQWSETNSLPINAVTPSLILNNYRNKAQFAFQRDKNSRLQLGLYRKSSHEVVDASYCDIQHTLVNKIVEQIRIFCVNKPSISIYDEPTQTGLLRHLIVRVGFATDEALICFVSASTQIPEMPELVKFLVNGPVGGKIKGILLHRNNEPGDVLLTNNDADTSVLHGVPYIHEEIAGILVKVSLRSFTQSNPLQARVLYQTALDLMNCTGGETVYDLYCGVGTIGLFVARNIKVSQVIGVEDIPAAVEDAIGNAKLNIQSSDVSNISFVCAKAENWLDKHAKAEKEVVIVNPPRRGCHSALLRQLRQRGVEKVIYISCNPTTLARDISLLTDTKSCDTGSNRYRVTCVQPVDMFPHTVHIETIVSLVKIL